MKLTGKLRSVLLKLAVLFLIGTVSLLIIFFAGRGSDNLPLFKGDRKVSVKNSNGNFKFYKDGQPFSVKGGVGYTHIRELAECGGNTLTCWDTANLAHTLEEASLYNISVIIGLDVPDPRDLNYYGNADHVSALLNAYRQIVNRYKNHPAVLAYCLGNELNFPFTLTKTNFYTTYQQLLDTVRSTDPHHPIATSMINVAKKVLFNLQWRVAGLDFICINTYNQLKTIEKDLRTMKLIWRGPYLVSEWAPNGGWEVATTSWNAPVENTSTKKAEQIYEFYTTYMPLKDPRFLGSMVFYWGTRQEYTNTWYSIFDASGRPNEIKEALNDCWKNTKTTHQSPQVDYMLIDSAGALDNIILTAGSKHKAFIVMPQKQLQDSLSYSWEIIKEDWPNWHKTWTNFKQPPAVPCLFTDSTRREVDFDAPPREGLYRVFVTASNSKGYCATANTPIYVVEK